MKELKEEFQKALHTLGDVELEEETISWKVTMNLNKNYKGTQEGTWKDQIIE